MASVARSRTPALLGRGARLFHCSPVAANSASSTSALAYKALHRRARFPSQPKIETPSWSASTAVSSILYEMPPANPQPSKSHVLNCLVQNEPGVLSRVAGILAARGFNIDSLVVCNTEVADLSRMTIVLQGQDGVIEQARRQLEDLVPVWAVLDYTNSPTIQRELLLCKVSLLGPEYFEELLAHHEHGISEAFGEESIGVIEEEESFASYHPSQLAPSEALRHKHEHLDAITKLAQHFGGKVVDISMNNCVVELSAKPDRITAFILLLQPFGILELARSGMMALTRSPLESSSKESKTAEDVVDVSQLPPG
ncbi:small subunit of acetolactate synthase-domain-containing protein [Lipomyces orientalis]|uniref:Small subunit of acetolactate synthase-domain-containing protein n=1 Tax=Lipomyces orientalis TaxID=1233043 RepID=A0ACC3TZV5_9ASCO